MNKPRHLTEDVCEVEKEVRRIKVGPTVVRFVQKPETVSKRIHRDDVACTCFEDTMHLHNFARFAGLLHALEHFSHEGFHNGLETTYAGDGEVGINRVAATAVQVVICCGYNRPGS